MIRSRWLLPVLAVLAALACSSGDECDLCNNNSDCKEGFVCTTFNDGSKRCGSGVGATTCRVR